MLQAWTCQVAEQMKPGSFGIQTELEAAMRTRKQQTSPSSSQSDRVLKLPSLTHHWIEDLLHFPIKSVAPQPATSRPPHGLWVKHAQAFASVHVSDRQKRRKKHMGSLWFLNGSYVGLGQVIGLTVVSTWTGRMSWSLWGTPICWAKSHADQNGFSGYIFGERRRELMRRYSL